MTRLHAPSTLAAALALSLLLPAAAQAAAPVAQTIVLDMHSRPSAQGWAFASLGDSAEIIEGTMFAASGGLLHQDTMGVGMSQGGGTWYGHAVQLVPGQNWSMTMVSRLLAFESVTNPPYPVGLFMGTDTGMAVGFGSNHIEYLGADGMHSVALPSSFNAAAFNSYEWRVANGLQSFFINGVAMFSSQSAPAGTPSSILFGDGTGLANARADIAVLSFASNVPEPGTWLLMALGLGFISARRLRRAGP